MIYRLSLPLALITALMFPMNLKAATDPLLRYRDKNRLIVFVVSTPSARDQLASAVSAHQPELTERDLKLIDLSLQPSHIAGSIRLEEKAAERLRVRLSLAASGKKSVFVLIGKDSGEKARVTGTLALSSWFDLIDQMPMRRQEMRQHRD